MEPIHLIAVAYINGVLIKTLQMEDKSFRTTETEHKGEVNILETYDDVLSSSVGHVYWVNEIKKRKHTGKEDI